MLAFQVGILDYFEISLLILLNKFCLPLPKTYHNSCVPLISPGVISMCLKNIPEWLKYYNNFRIHPHNLNGKI